MNDVESLLAHAIANVPRYAGLQPRLSQFPIVHKREMIEHPDQFLSCTVGSIKEAIATELAAPQNFGNHWKDSRNVWAKDIVIEETSGTSGVPFRFPRTTQERARIGFGIWKQRKAIDPEASVSRFYPFFHHPRSFHHPVDPLDCSSSNVERLYHGLAGQKTRWVHTYPGLIRRHAEAFAGAFVTGHPLRYVETSGSFLTAETAELVERTMGVKTVSQYGCMECLAIAYGTKDAVFSALTENVHVEIVDDHGEPICAPMIKGNVVITAKHQRLFPFIRYWTGDTAAWDANAVGTTFVLHNRNRDIEDLARWGSYKSGANYFRIMLAKVFSEVGFIKLRVLRVRELSAHSFCILTENIPEGERLRASLENVCRADPVMPDIIITREILCDDLLTYELQRKPTLFLPKSVAKGDDVQSRPRFISRPISPEWAT